MDFKFFTDRSVQNDYLLIKVKDYLKMRSFARWKIIFIDPGVYELRGSIEYAFIPKMEVNKFIKNLPQNHYFSLDYPSDMNLDYQDLFMKKSWLNAQKYSKYESYIVTVQSKFQNLQSYKGWFKRYNALDIKSGILAIGNLCRIPRLSKLLKETIRYSFENCDHKWIHIYGLCLQGIVYALKQAEIYDINFSVDSTKWTRACTQELKDKFGRVHAHYLIRQQFFDEYLKLIQKKLRNMNPIDKKVSEFRELGIAIADSKNTNFRQISTFRDILHDLLQRSKQNQIERRREKSFYDWESEHK